VEQQGRNFQPIQPPTTGHARLQQRSQWRLQWSAPAAVSERVATARLLPPLDRNDGCSATEAVSVNHAVPGPRSLAVFAAVQPLSAAVFARRASATTEVLYT